MELVFTFTLIIVGGFLPALIWLWLILREDRAHPEPRQRLILSFMAGMGAVITVLPVQAFLSLWAFSPIITLVLFAASEEIFKFLFSYSTALHSKDADEPLDEVIYMITTALGFAALENCLFVAKPFLDGNIFNAILIAHVRFMGSTLVHTASSGIVGLFLAKAFYKKSKIKAVVIGLCLAVTLHSLYNFLIIDAGAGNVLNAFIGLWIVCVVLVLVLNHSKKHFVHE